MTVLQQSTDTKAWENMLLPVFENQQTPSNYQPQEWEPVINHILHSQPAPANIRRIPVFARIAAAAAVVISVAAGAWLFYNKPASRPLAQQSDKAPVSNKAMLTLADGRTIPLDSATAGLLATQGNANIQKGAGNALTYTGSNTTANAPLQFNTLSTPRGGQFQLALPDGSKVWLNAASSIRYPVSFAANERRVELQGEAYFEVKPDARAPFRVQSRSQNVEVLGTSFNVNDYTDEVAAKTTLLEGKVRVQEYLLTPGQQLIVQNNTATLVPNADIDQAVAWKNGSLDMRGLDVKALMRQITRLYDVEVVYEGTVPQGIYGGIIDPRKVYLSNIIEVLQSQGIRCRLEGSKLYVSSAK